MECSICSDILSFPYQLVCGHVFHKECLTAWENLNPICPNCRGPAQPHPREVVRSVFREAAEEGKLFLEEQELAAKEAADFQAYIAANGDMETSVAFAPLESPNSDALEYPLSFLEKSSRETPRFDSLCQNYSVKAFCEGLLGEDAFDVGDFPRNITEYYWIHQGVNDETPWYLLCGINAPTGPAYAFYTAACDYTGFDCQGGMRMWVSRDAKNLFYSLTEEQRRMCLEEKRAGKQLTRGYDWAEIQAGIDKNLNAYYEAVAKPPAADPTKAFFRLFHNDVEVPVSYNNLIKLMIDKDLEYAIRGLTAAYLDPKPARPVPGWRPRKKFYEVQLLAATIVGIDDVFKRRFGNKRWTLRMPTEPVYSTYTRSFVQRPAGKLEIQFLLF